MRSNRDGNEIKIINDPPEQLNIEKLKQRENILFYDDITLFEDELHDSGISNLNVKLVSITCSTVLLYLEENYSFTPFMFGVYVLID